MGKASKAKRDRLHRRPEWTPFKRAVHGRKKLVEKYPAIARHGGLDAPLWLNSRYQVSVHPMGAPPEGWPEMVSLCIKPLDQDEMRIDWRDFQRIKNEILGPEHEAVQLFPRESRLVDTANQFHLWCIKSDEHQFPFGFWERVVTEEEGHGTRQRKFEEKPEDSLNADELHQRFKELK